MYDPGVTCGEHCLSSAARCADDGNCGRCLSCRAARSWVSLYRRAATVLPIILLSLQPRMDSGRSCMIDLCSVPVQAHASVLQGSLDPTSTQHTACHVHFTPNCQVANAGHSGRTFWKQWSSSGGVINYRPVEVPALLFITAAPVPGLQC